MTRFSVPVESRRVEIEARVRASGPDWIVFIHGLGCVKESFDDAFASPHLEGLSLLAMDLPGHGASDRPAELGYSMEEHAEAVAGLMAEAGAGRAHLVGHSMGGAVTMLLTDRLDEPPLSHVSIEGNLVGDDCRFGSRRTASTPIEEFVTEGIAALRSPPAPDASLGEALYPAWVKRVDPVALHRSAASLVTWSDSERLLGRFLEATEPKIYLYGARNDDAEVLRRLPGVEQVAVEGAGHFVMNDRPEAFYRHLASFVDSCP